MRSPAFDLSSATIRTTSRPSHEAGLVECERRGTFVYYWIQPAAVCRCARCCLSDEPAPAEGAMAAGLGLAAAGLAWLPWSPTCRATV